MCNTEPTVYQVYKHETIEPSPNERRLYIKSYPKFNMLTLLTRL